MNQPLQPAEAKEYLVAGIKELLKLAETDICTSAFIVFQTNKGSFGKVDLGIPAEGPDLLSYIGMIGTGAQALMIREIASQMPKNMDEAKDV